MRKILNLPLAAYGRANDNQIRSEFSQELPACSARHDRLIRIRRHSNRNKIPFSTHNCGTDRDSFGANRLTERPVLNVSAGKNSARLAFDGRSDSEF